MNKSKLKNLKYEVPGEESASLRKEIITMLLVSIGLPIAFCGVALTSVFVDANGLWVILFLVCVFFAVRFVHKKVFNK